MAKLNCKVCGKKVLPAYARGRFREYQIGYYCPKCNRFFQKPGENVKIEVPVAQNLV
jgi:rubredoxin